MEPDFFNNNVCHMDTMLKINDYYDRAIWNEGLQIKKIFYPPPPRGWSWNISRIIVRIYQCVGSIFLNDLKNKFITFNLCQISLGLLIASDFLKVIIGAALNHLMKKSVLTHNASFIFQTNAQLNLPSMTLHKKI